jgi:hypothetical protein
MLALEHQFALSERMPADSERRQLAQLQALRDHAAPHRGVLHCRTRTPR